MAIVTRVIEQFHVMKISEDFPVILLDMGDSSELYYSLHGKLYFDEEGLDKWISFSGKDHVIFSKEDIVFIYNPANSSGDLTFKYDEYPDMLEGCGTTCPSFPMDKAPVEEYVI